MADEVEVIDLSDDEPAPPAKVPKLENGGTTSTENGSSSNLKKTARKKMSSFTPKLNPTETITLDAEEDKKSNDSQHQQYKEIESKIMQYLHEIRGYVNSVEHATIKKKMDKRLSWVAKLPSKFKLDSFIEKLASLVEKVIAKPNNVFEITKELLDEYERYKPGSTEIATNSTGKSNGDSAPTAKVEASNEDRYKYQKRKSHIKKLNKALRQCNREIRRLEEAELDLDELDDEDSSYIKQSKYKKRAITLLRKINSLEGMKTSFGRASDKKFKTEASRIPEVNSRIQDLINKDRRFPDYHDILRIHKTVCEDKSLGYSKQEVMHMAKETFVQVGRNLKNRRYRDDMDVIESYIPEDTNEEEPPEKDSVELQKILEQNEKEAQQAMSLVVNEFAEKQEFQKEVAKEVADDEPESDKEDGEEDEEDDQDDKDDDLNQIDHEDQDDNIDLDGLDSEEENQNGHESDQDDQSIQELDQDDQNGQESDQQESDGSSEED